MYCYFEISLHNFHQFVQHEMLVRIKRVQVGIFRELNGNFVPLLTKMGIA